LTNCPLDQKIVALFFRNYFNFYHCKSFRSILEPSDLSLKSNLTQHDFTN